VLRDIYKLMSSYTGSWWIAGGWAIDLHLGHQSRPHHDIDIAVLRQDQHLLRDYLSDWAFQKVVNGSLQPWPADQFLELPVHELYAQQAETTLEFLLNESENDRWLFRRNREVSQSVSNVTRKSADGIPYLSPEVVLLYKSKAIRPHDNEDFETTLPTLDISAKEWLAASLEQCHAGHEWISRLR